MSKNTNLHKAKNAKNDEFYTQYSDIEKEVMYYLEYNKDVFKDKTILLPCDDPEWSNFTKYFIANFTKFGLKKIISTSYAKSAGNKFISELERNSPNFDKQKNKTHGKLFIFDKSNITSSQVNYNNVDFIYLDGDGDFRSDEVKKLRDEADIIVTNPPFSLFREFLTWILDSNKNFIIIGNKNAVKYKEVFPLIMNNKVWLGCTIPSEFILPDGSITKKVNGLCRWFTNIDHDKRHKNRNLSSIADNLKYNKKLLKKLNKMGCESYPKYDNYDALEVLYCDAIPSDYEGIMGVPITFLDEYNPSQFEIVGEFNHGSDNEFDLAAPSINKQGLYPRIAIRKRKNRMNEEDKPNDANNS